MSRFLGSIDWSLLTPSLLLSIIGLATLSSIDFAYFYAQLGFIIVGIFFYIFFSYSNYRVLEHFGTKIYIVSLIALIILLVIGIESRGAVRWITFFGRGIQFSEIFKPFLAISLAAFLAKRERPFTKVVFTALFLIPVAFLLYKQPDLGNALIYMAVTILVLVVDGIPFLWLLGGIVVFLGILPVAFPLLHNYQRQRIMTFLNPSHDPLGTSYNAIQSVIAVGSGMIFGKGLGAGTQSILRFLPERHTDFIFATVSEAFGFLGTAITILLFIFLLYRVIFIFEHAPDKFSKLFSASIFFLLLIQLFVNAGMNIGLVPIVGVTLPFVSFGGSSLVSNFIALGFLSSISMDIRKSDVLEIR